MKKNYMKIVVMACAACMVMAGCGKDDDGKDDGVYPLPQTLSEDEIVSLLNEAEKAMESTKNFTSVFSGDFSFDDFKHQFKVEYIYDGDAKKRVEVSYRGYQGQEKIGYFSYVEGTDCYYYNFLPSASGRPYRSVEWLNSLFTDVGTATKEIQRPTTDADKYYCYLQGHSGSVFNIGYTSGIPSPSSRSAMWLENGKIVVADTSYYSMAHMARRLEIVLNASKQYRHVKHFESGTIDDEKIVLDGEFTFTYSAATPALPNGFSTSDFGDKRPEYYSILIAWGEGKGKNTFWVRKGGSLNAVYDVADYAPSVAGKEIKSVTIDNKNYTTSEPITVSRDTEGSVTWGAKQP